MHNATAEKNSVVRKDKMNNKERIEEFKRIKKLVNSYDFSKYPIVMEDSLGNKIKYPLDDEDVYLKVRVVLSISGLKNKEVNSNDRQTV